MDYQFGELFERFWWLLFPLAFFIAAAWNSFMRYKRTQAKIDLIKSYTAAGREPPSGLIESLDRDEGGGDWTGMSDDSHGGGRQGGGSAFLVLLFAGLAGVFAYAGYTGWLGGNREEFYFIAMIMGVMAVAFLGAAIFGGGKSRHGR